MKALFSSLLILILTLTNVWGHEGAAIDSMIIKGKAQLQSALNSWDLSQLLNARAFFERLQQDQTYPWLIHFYIGYADSRITEYFFSKNPSKNDDAKEQAQKYIEDCIAQLEKSIELKDDFAESYALMSSILGKKIGLSPIKGVFLGPKSGGMIGKAFKLASKNPRVNLIAGQNAFYTPKIFGGGIERAMKHVQRAITLFDSVKVENPILPDWGHAEAFAYQGMILMKQENFADAKKSYEQALEINPDYAWVKFALMKDLEAKMAVKK